jgi:hypothetical protein
LPRLAGGKMITGCPADKAPRLALSDRRRGVIESLEPIALERLLTEEPRLRSDCAKPGGALEPAQPLVDDADSQAAVIRRTAKASQHLADPSRCRGLAGRRVAQNAWPKARARCISTT